MGFWGIFDTIYSSSFGKSSLKTTMSAKNTDIAASLAKSKAVSGFNSFGVVAAQDISLVANGEAAKRVIKKGERISVNNSKELQEIMGMNDVFTPLQDNAQQEAFKAAMDNYRKYTGPSAALSGEDFQKFIGREGKEGLGVFGTARGYFSDETYGSARLKTTLGAGAAAAVGMRYLSGGNLTTTAQGERNIAGIPFI